MTSPYRVPLATLAPAPQGRTAKGPAEPGGAVPEPLPAGTRAGEGPLDSALPVNAVAVSGGWRSAGPPAAPA